MAPSIPSHLIEVADLAGVNRRISNTRSNHVILLQRLSRTKVSLNMNQRLRKLYVRDCQDCTVQLMDSLVVMSREAIFVNCSNLLVTADQVDVRNWRFYNCLNVTIQLGDSETLLDTSEISFTACTGSIIFERVVIKPGTNPNLHDILPIVVVANQRFALGSTAADGVLRIPDGRNATFETPSTPAQKTAEDVNAEIAQLAEETERMLKTSTNEDKARWYEEELKETLDDPPAMLSKVREIASAIRAARHVVVYTGAGISTSADLPDYRGPNGLWTNKNAPRKKITLSGAHPTFAHYALAYLVRKGLVHFITSTNMDGLHRRSGVPGSKLSELHGNCYIEHCGRCGREHLRIFDLQSNWFSEPVNVPTRMYGGLTRLLLSGNPLPCSAKMFNYSSLASDTDYEFGFSDRNGWSNTCCPVVSLGKLEAPFKSVFPAADQETYSIESADACSRRPGYFGRVRARCASFREWIVVSDCEKCLCPAERGVCNNGSDGDGTCTACTGFFTGPYCNISVIPEPPSIIQLDPESGGTSRLRLLAGEPVVLRMLFKKPVRLVNETAWLAIRNPGGSYVNITAASTPEAFSVGRTGWSGAGNGTRNESAWALTVKVPGNSISRPSSIYSVLLGAGSVVSVENGLSHLGIGLSTTDRSWVLLSDSSAALDLRYTIRARFPAKVTLLLDLSQINTRFLPSGQEVDAAAVLAQDRSNSGVDLRLRLEAQLRKEISAILAIPTASTAEKFAFSRGDREGVIQASFRIFPASSSLSALSPSASSDLSSSTDGSFSTEDGRSPAGLATILQELSVAADASALRSGLVTRAIVTGSVRWGPDSPADANLQSTEGQAITIGSLATVFALCLLVLILHHARRKPSSRFGDLCSLWLSLGSITADFAFVILFLGRLSEYGYRAPYIAGLVLIATTAGVNLGAGLALFFCNLYPRLVPALSGSPESVNAHETARELAAWVESNMFIVAPVLVCNMASADNSLVLSSHFMGLNCFSAPLTIEAERRMRLAGSIRLLLSSAPMLILNIFVLLSVGELSTLNFASIVLSILMILYGVVRKITEWILFVFQSAQPGGIAAANEKRRSSGPRKSQTSEHIETHITISTKRVSIQTSEPSYQVKTSVLVS